MIMTAMRLMQGFYYNSEELGASGAKHEREEELVVGSVWALYSWLSEIVSGGSYSLLLEAFYGLTPICMT